MKESDKKVHNIDKWVKKTNGLSLSHLKELIVSVCILDKDLDEVLNHFSDMKRTRSSRVTNMGFKTSKNGAYGGVEKEIDY